jgi:hypothetical protein
MGDSAGGMLNHSLHLCNLQRTDKIHGEVRQILRNVNKFFFVVCGDYVSILKISSRFPTSSGYLGIPKKPQNPSLRGGEYGKSKNWIWGIKNWIRRTKKVFIYNGVLCNEHQWGIGKHNRIVLISHLHCKQKSLLYGQTVLTFVR